MIVEIFSLFFKYHFKISCHNIWSINSFLYNTHRFIMFFCFVDFPIHEKWETIFHFFAHFIIINFFFSFLDMKTKIFIIFYAFIDFFVIVSLWCYFVFTITPHFLQDFFLLFCISKDSDFLHRFLIFFHGETFFILFHHFFYFCLVFLVWKFFWELIN